jgi:hypothetical protein
VLRYRNKPVEIDGVKYASKAEARRGAELRLLARAGQITDLEAHPAFPMVINGVRVCTYNADFRYRDASGAVVVEDVKSPATAKDPVYRIKNKLLKALHGIQIREVA